MASITTVAKVKTRCGIAVGDTSQDALIAYLIGETERRFEGFLHRTLHRAAGLQDEFFGDTKMLQVVAPPVEAVTAWELLDDEAAGWVALAAPPKYQLHARRSIIMLETPVGTPEQRLRVTYTGGYTFQDEIPAAGQTPLPSWVEECAITQVAHVWQLRDKINVSRVEVSTGIQWSIADFLWAPPVRFALSQATKNTYLGHS